MPKVYKAVIAANGELFNEKQSLKDKIINSNKNHYF